LLTTALLRARILCLAYVSESRASRSTESSASHPAAAALAFSSSSQPPYEYRYFAPGEDWFPRPMVPISVRGPKAIVSDHALADTGADSTSFPLGHMDDFGIGRGECNEQEVTSADGAGTQFVYPKPLLAQVEDVQFPIIAAFMDTPVVLLGQEDFFKHFEVTFDYRGQRVVLKPYPKQPIGP